jgi:hypothetical protein
LAQDDVNGFPPDALPVQPQTAVLASLCHRRFAPLPQRGWSMHYSQHHCHGGDAWGSQTFAQLAHQHGQSTAQQYSDVPPSNGQLSDALKHKLAEEDLLDMEVLLRYRGVRTLRALESLETTERAVLLCKARELYELLGIFPSNLKNTLNKLFGDVPQQGMFHASPWAMQSGAMPYMHPQWAGHGGWGHHALPTSRPGGPEPLTDPLDDDTYLKRTLGAALLGAREIVGWERYTECLRRLKRSDELVVASCLEAAEALAALGIRKEDVRDRERKEALKAAKKAVRDVLLWRCTGNALGLDSREALVRAFEEACRHTHCDENTVSQLTNGYRRIREELAGGPPPKIRIATSPGRRNQDRQANGTASEDQGAAAASNGGSQATADGPRTMPAILNTASENPGAVASGSGGSGDAPKTVPALFDTMGPSSSDPVLVQPSFACPPGLESSMILQGEKPTERRSLPPARRSPGAPKSRDGGHSLQMAQMMEMMKAMTHQLQEVKSQVGKLQQDCDPFPFRPVIPYDDDDEDDDRGRPVSCA